MPKHMTIINLACTITKLRKWGQAWKYSAESAQNAASQLTAEHERKLTEHRAAFGARTEADAKIIAGLREELNQVRNSLGIQAAKEANKVLGMVDGEGLRGAAERVVKERDGLLTQVQDMRAERERLRSENQIMRNDAEDGYAEAIKVLGDPIALSKERDALRAEVAALQKRLRASIARGDFAQMEVAALMSQTPKQHPVAVGEWVKRTQSGMWSIGTTGKVAVVLEGAGCYELTSGETWDWRACEPCDPPATHDTPEGRSVAEAAVKREPKPGDVVRLVRVPTPDEYPHDTGRWEPNWGGIGDYMRVHHVGNNISGTRIVRAVFGLEWPISCVEIVSDEPDEIKVGDLVEVYQDRLIGRVIGVTTSDDNSFIVTIENNGMETVALADVRKVTT